MKQEAGLKHSMAFEPTLADGDFDLVEARLSAEVPPELTGQRLDIAAARLFPDFSRSRLQRWIETGHLRLDGELSARRHTVTAGMEISLQPQLAAEGAWLPEPMHLPIIYQDDDLIVVDKPAGLVVHPAAGNPDGTLLNGLLARWPELAGLPRAGIVHRLDKDTTGLMVVAHSARAQTMLVNQLQDRSMTRKYLALVAGNPPINGKIDAPLGRSPHNRQKMAVTRNGRPAVTRFRVLERFTYHALVELSLETGRTHQIRVHMTHAGFPLVGDPQYGGGRRAPSRTYGPDLQEALRLFPRQALHAFELHLNHPATGERMQWTSPMANDFAALLELFRTSSNG